MCPASRDYCEHRGRTISRGYHWLSEARIWQRSVSTSTNPDRHIPWTYQYVWRGQQFEWARDERRRGHSSQIWSGYFIVRKLSFDCLNTYTQWIHMVYDSEVALPQQTLNCWTVSWRYHEWCSTCILEYVLTSVWHARVNLRISFQIGPPLPKLVGGPCFPTDSIPVDVALCVNVQKRDSGRAVSVNLRATDHTYLLTRIFVSVSRHQILPSFAFHLSLHWSRVRVPSIHSNTAFQNLGVLAGVLPSASIACITWFKRTTSSAVHGPAWSSAIYESLLVVGGIPERRISRGTRCLWNRLRHAETERSRASLISTQVNCWSTSLDDRQLVQRSLCSISTDNFNLESSRVVQGPLSRKGSYKSWARSLTEWTRLPGTPRAMTDWDSDKAIEIS